MMVVLVRRMRRGAKDETAMTTSTPMMLELANQKIDEALHVADSRALLRDVRPGVVGNLRQRFGALLIVLGRRLGGTMPEARAEPAAA